MVLLFDREPAEALEDGVVCSGYWSGAIPSSESVSICGEGGRWPEMSSI